MRFISTGWFPALWKTASTRVGKDRAFVLCPARFLGSRLLLALKMRGYASAFYTSVIIVGWGRLLARDAAFLGGRRSLGGMPFPVETSFPQPVTKFCYSGLAVRRAFASHLHLMRNFILELLCHLVPPRLYVQTCTIRY
jgi:hypothetical protein